ncbi:MAG: carboxypeptidase-like regulatory domain-containing protein [Nannocystaceae bacterium]
MPLRIAKLPLLILATAAVAALVGCGPLDEAEASATDGGTATTSASATAGETSGATSGATGETGAGADGECDFEADIQPIFTARCATAGCHGAMNPQLGLDLSPGAAFAALVGIQSAGQPDKLLVSAGEPAASVLVDKLSATPSAGLRMPVGAPLSDAELARIDAWITAGAQPSATFACAGGSGETGGAAEVGDVVVDPVDALEVGELASLTAAVTDPEGNPLPDASVTWRTSDGLTLYADGEGAVLGVSPGSAEIVASAGGVDSAPLAIQVVPATPAAATFAEVRALLVASCAIEGCHVDGVEPGDLRFDRPADKLWEELVEDAAEQVPGLQRVAANAPRDSYLMHKLALDVPAVGARMPVGGRMPAADAQIVLAWILDGAPF